MSVNAENTPISSVAVRSLARSVIPFLNWPSNSPSAHSLTSPSPPARSKAESLKASAPTPARRLYYTFPPSLPPSLAVARPPKESHKYILFDICIRIRVVVREGRFFAAGDKRRRRRRSLLASHSLREICRTKHGEKLPPTVPHSLARSLEERAGVDL